MALQGLINTSIERLTSVPDKFVTATESTQLELLKEVNKMIAQLETDGGNFVYSTKNLDILEGIDKAINDAVFNDEYVSSLTDYIGEFEKQADLKNSIFAKQFDGFEVKDIYNATKENGIKTSLELFSEDSFASTITAPITQQLNQAIISGASFSDTVESVTNFIVGNGEEVNGTLLNYVKTNSYDAFAIFDSSYSQAINTDLGIEWFRYIGGLRDNSRCFCEKRNNKYYHKKEIEAWGRMEDLGECRSDKGWQGMRKGTNEFTIFSFRGGYNCDHVISAVSKASVPNEVIERNKQKGNI